MLLASCGTEIKFHRWPSGDYHGSFQIPEAGLYIPSISWCSDGELLVTTVPSLGPPIVISVAGLAIQTYQVVDLPQVQAATFSRTIQNIIAFGTENGRVMLYDVNKKSVIQYLPFLPCGVKYLQYGAKDVSLVAGCRNGQICLYNSENNVAATFYVPNANSLTAMSCHAKLSNILAAACTEGVVVVWDSSTGNTKFLDKPHTNSITDVAFSSGDDMATVGLDERFIGYDMRTKDCTFCCKTQEQLSAVEFMPTGDKIAVASTGGKLFCYDRRQIAHPIHTIVAHHPKAIGRIAFQNVTFCEESMPNEKSEIRKNDNIRSNMTTVVYNSSRHNPYSSNTDFADTISSQHPSTINTIIPDAEPEWQIPISEQFTADLESLKYNNSAIPNRGDADNRVMIGLDCLNETQIGRRIACDTIPPPLMSSSSVEHMTINRIPGAMNILNRFLVTSKNPNRSVSDKSLDKEDVVDDLDPCESDGVTSWMKKLPVNTSRSTNNVTALMDHEEDIVKLRRELQEVTKDTLEQVAEMINREFLKIRMAMGRGFVQMEYKMDARWKDFNVVLMKMAGYELPNVDMNLDEVDKTTIHQPTSSHITTRSNAFN